MKKVLFILLLAVSAPAFPASVIRSAKEAIKKKSNLEQTAKTLLAEAVKPETPYKDRIECYQLAAECAKGVYDAENMKLYLKQAYDTTKFFNAIVDMYNRIYLADSVARTPDEKGKVQNSNQKRNHDFLLNYRKNLLAGANWFYRHDQYPKAYELFDVYIDAANHPLFEKDQFMQKDTILPMSAYLAVISAQKANHSDGILKYASLAKQAGQKSHLVQEYIVKAWEAKKDTAQWESALWDGLSAYPSHPYFFTHLLDHMVVTGKLEQGLEVVNNMIKVKDEEPLFWYAKSLILLKLNRDAEVVEACDACIHRDSTFTDAYYNKGIAALNLAVTATENASTDLDDPQTAKDLETIKDYYRLAKEPMERVRRDDPENTERWAAPLYRIYLNLNMGKEFDEMDNILNGN